MPNIKGKKKPLAKKRPVAAKSASKTVKVKPYASKHYAEEGQITGFHYVFLSNQNEMCHHWIKCRDFLQDALRNQLTGRADQIYSFHYQPGKDPKVDTARTRMLVKRIPCPNNAATKKEFNEMMMSALQLVNHYERKYKFTPISKFVKAEMPGEQYPYLFVGPGVWSQGSIMISIYTFLIRLGYFRPVFKDSASLIKAYEKIISGKQQTNDTRYLKVVHKNFDPALKHLADHLFKPPGWEKGDKILFHDSVMSSFHHHSGIVRLSQFGTPVAELNDKFRKVFGAK